ncbi:stage III sporulation protein AB [Orenia metallireducens]|jgi:stage III sporulation protein AB|uniref:stage III sporulation protein SpoIIIAB n=1 Tax=Orenia metallireducens TaxID=1413210 RepID=UPI000D078556|nr:stage III sporulation protein SpoIIIAB [Orenia metallireducens]PRX26900.1 stage III sporulation protein AB [Orenia metallireducens]
MKLLGALIIISSSTTIGFIIAEQYLLRPKQLRELQTALQMLETEISYGVTPLPDAFAKLATSLSAPISTIFQVAQEELDSGMIAEEAWHRAVNATYNQTALVSEDIDVLLDFGYNLGQTSIDDQVKYMNLAQHKLDALYQQAFTEKEEKVKLWRYLGVLVGVFLAILIF